YAFAGTKDGRLYRWDAVLGWKLIWEDPISQYDNRVHIGTLYMDPRVDFSDILYVGTGSIDMRHTGADRQHPKEYGNGEILRFDGATSTNIFKDPTDRIRLPPSKVDNLCNEQQPNILKILIIKKNEIEPKPWHVYVATDLGVYHASMSDTEKLNSSMSFNLHNKGLVGEDRNCRSLAWATDKTTKKRYIIVSVDYNFCKKTPGQIYRQEIGETCWFITNGLICDDRRLWDIVADYQNRNALLYACDHAHEGALYISKDAGANWSVVFDTNNLCSSEAGGYGGVAPKTPFQCRYAVLSSKDIYVVGANRGGIWRINRNDLEKSQCPIDHEYLTAECHPLNYDYWKGKGHVEFTAIDEVVFTLSYSRKEPPLLDHICIVIFDYVGMMNLWGDDYWKMFGQMNEIIDPCEHPKSKKSFAGTGRGYSIAVNPSDSQMLFLSYARASEPPIVLGSSDAGKNWIVMANECTNSFKTHNDTHKRVPIGCLLVKYESAKQWLYLAGPVSDGKTKGWSVRRTNITTGITSNQWQDPGAPSGVSGSIILFSDSDHLIYDMDSSCETSPTIFLATEFGLFTSINNGRSWGHFQGSANWRITKVEAISTTQAYVIVVDSADMNRNKVIAVSVDNHGKASIYRVVETFPIRPTDLLFRNDVLYVATRTEGIISFNVTNNYARSTFLDQGSGLPTNDTFSIDFDPEGNAYVGTHCYGLWKIKHIKS
ncbi:MAG: hypothetical protein ACFFAU_19670, partial [Candidatus Hodarchaeota archaeon]